MIWLVELLRIRQIIYGNFERVLDAVVSFFQNIKSKFFWSWGDVVLIPLSLILEWAIFFDFGLTRLLLHFLDHLERLLRSYDRRCLLDDHFLGILRSRGFAQVWIDCCGGASCRVNYHHILRHRPDVLLLRKHLLSLIKVLWYSTWLLWLLVWLPLGWLSALLDEIGLLNGWPCVLLRFFASFRPLLWQIMGLLLAKTEALYLLVWVLSDWA